jgi:hypothetical protein
MSAAKVCEQIHEFPADALKALRLAPGEKGKP